MFVIKWLLLTSAFGGDSRSLDIVPPPPYEYATLAECKRYEPLVLEYLTTQVQLEWLRKGKTSVAFIARVRCVATGKRPA